MNKRSKLAALLGAGLLTFGIAGIALATGPSDQGVTPTTVLGKNIGAPGEGGNAKNKDFADCAGADALKLDSGSGTTGNGVTVTVTVGSGNAVGFVATGGTVNIAYIKGGHGYNEYDYADPGVSSDGHLYAPNAGNSGKPAGLSHAVFCTTAGPGGGGGGETDQPPTDTAVGTTGSSGPTDTAWLLVVALGVLLASIVVLTPARAKSRR